MTVAPPDVLSGRRREIRAAKLRATGLLVVVAVAFVLVVLTTDDRGGGGYLRAGLEAAMVGGLADWFAVVAIFRHPLGLPIPHTAVIVARKDAFGETLGQFVQEHFLSPDNVAERIRVVGPAERAATWVSVPEHADRVAGYAADLVVRLAEVVQDDDLVHVAEHQVRTRLAEVDVAPLAGRLLELVTEEGRHRELIDGVLQGLDSFLAENEPLLRERYGQEAPWWIPEVVDDRIFARLLSGVRAIVRGDTVGGSDELRRRIDVVLERVVDRLEHDGVWAERAEALKDELLDHPALRSFLASLWTDLKAALREQAAAEESVLRQRLAEMATHAAERFLADPALVDRADRMVESTVRGVLDTFGDEITRLISTTIEQWDAEETADRLELLLGRDLQWIRINGTVVGGIAGLAIHAVAVLLA